MLNSLKFVLFLIALGLFNTVTSIAVFSTMSSAHKKESFSFVVESSSESAAMWLEPKDELVFPLDALPRLEGPSMQSPSEAEVMESLGQILTEALKNLQTQNPVDKSNLDEAGLFSAPGPKKNLI